MTRNKTRLMDEMQYWSDSCRVEALLAVEGNRGAQKLDIPPHVTMNVTHDTWHSAPVTHLRDVLDGAAQACRGQVPAKAAAAGVPQRQDVVRQIIPKEAGASQQLP